MKTVGALAVAFAATAVLATPSPAQVDAQPTLAKRSSLPTITTKGNAFYNGDTRFYIKGIDYQPGGSSNPIDPLADPSICNRDIPYFKQLGVNTVRVYTIDNSKNHDTCMSALADAGIYLALDVNTPLYSLTQADTAKSYNPFYLQSVFATVDAFATYSNTLLFFSGNEVINKENTTGAAPYVKAVTRDIKQYLGERGFRDIPVGYSAADVSENQLIMAHYMNCGSAPSRSDFYAINNYEWCDPSSLQQSGWDTLASEYADYSIPVFMSEYGCIEPTESVRDFDETVALYSSTMTKSFSGGLVFEYSQEGNDYGIVTINGNTVKPFGSQFSDLQSALKKVSEDPPSGDGGASTSNKPSTCPPQGPQWDTKPFEGEALPATPSGALKYFKDGAGPGPGLNGKGSTWETGGSSATAAQSAGAVTATFGNGQSSSGSSGATAIQFQITPMMVAGVAVAAGFAFGAAIF